MSDNRVSASIMDSQFHTMTNDRVKETVGVCCCPDVTETLARAISSMFESHIRSLSTILGTQPIDRAFHLSTNNTCYCIHIHNSLRLKEYESDFFHDSSTVSIREYCLNWDDIAVSITFWLAECPLIKVNC